MDPFTVGLTLTTKALAGLASTAGGMIAKQLFTPPTAGAGLVERPVRLAGLVSWRGGKKQLAGKEIGKLVGTLYREAAKNDPKIAEFGEAQRDRVIQAVTGTLLAMDALDMDLVQAAHLDADRLAAALFGQAASAVSGLAPEERAVVDLLVGACCVHVIEFFTRRPEFVARTGVEQSKAIGTLLDRTSDPHDHVTEFETTLRQRLLDKLDEVTVFGLRLVSLEDRTYQLSTAYVNLSVQTMDIGADATGSPLARSGRAGGHGGLRVEDAFAGRRRMLLEGPAGSGKTTLLRRLAVHALRGELPGQLADWNDPIPFVLPLRDFVRDGRLELPQPDRFVAAIAGPLAAKEPRGWAVDVLQDGRALVLIDGVDEVPQSHRDQVLDWVKDLTTFLPDACYIVTSRPAAVSKGWRQRLEHLGFSIARLEPMTPAQVADFIDRWHRAIALTGAADIERLDEYARALRSALVRRRDLARLATNPLLCAMLCTLNRVNNQYLPRGRTALYEDALEMLLTRRDADQRIASTVRLDRDQLEPLLSTLAIWMTLNGRRTIPHDTALRRIEEMLPRIRGRRADDAELTAEGLLKHLRERSGLLQEPTVELLEFRHPSFQDYLGAREIFQRDYLDHLLKNAHDPLYHDIAIMAVGQHQRDPDRQRTLLEGLTRRAAKDKEHSRQLWLLAAACIADLGVVDPAISDQIHRETQRLLPPRDLDEADIVARAGEFVLDLLAEAAERRDFTDEEAAATVRIARLLAVDDALPLVRRFHHRRTPAIQQELVTAWAGSADQERYADEVLADAAIQDTMVPLPDLTLLPLLEKLSNLRRLKMPSPTQSTDLTTLTRSPTRRTHLSHLLLGGTGVVDVSPLAGLTNLASLYLTGTGVVDVSPLAGLTNLAHLGLTGTGVVDVSPLAGLTNLAYLDLDGTGVVDVGTLDAIPRVSILGAKRRRWSRRMGRKR